MNTPKVSVCEATTCAYNEEKKCRAFAITVGSQDAASCGTYTPEGGKGGITMTVANVGACKMSGCKHNENLMCTKSDVEVGVAGGQVSCMSFEAK